MPRSCPKPIKSKYGGGGEHPFFVFLYNSGPRGTGQTDPYHIFLIDKFYHKSSFRLQQNWVENTKVLYPPVPKYPWHPHQHPSPKWSIFYNWCTYTDTSLSPKTHSLHKVTNVTLGVPHTMGLDKCIMTCIHYYSVIQNSFTALKILCTLPIHASFPSTP